MLPRIADDIVSATTYIFFDVYLAESAMWTFISLISAARGNDDKASNAAKSNVPYEKSPDLFKPMTTEFQISSEHVVNFAIIGGADTPSIHLGLRHLSK
ncbi:hypothetical protein PV327_004065 [Microctonus hyperodae]|uniref:Uncharacterized protein n=1 Tax=Microctonus hyperodae TaxID=165561 RepID=A0AA39KMA7_MICHY|nr:hypothetical protein PV327_004065 [Microctonus hyperodae]